MQEQDDTLQPENERASAAPPAVLDGAMRTGEGADDEPEMTLGDRYGENAPDGAPSALTVEEAERLLPVDEPADEPVDEPDEGAPGAPGAPPPTPDEPGPPRRG